jgi:hypothetical protein
MSDSLYYSNCYNNNNQIQNASFYVNSTDPNESTNRTKNLLSIDSNSYEIALAPYNYNVVKIDVVDENNLTNNQLLENTNFVENYSNDHFF